MPAAEHVRESKRIAAECLSRTNAARSAVDSLALTHHAIAPDGALDLSALDALMQSQPTLFTELVIAGIAARLGDDCIARTPGSSWDYGSPDDVARVQLDSRTLWAPRTLVEQRRRGEGIALNQIVDRFLAR